MIHYHGGPLSGPKDVMGRFWARRHAMVSYAYPDTLPIIAESVQSFALDNGAFTEWKRDKGEKPYDYDGYVAWVMEWWKHPAFAWCLIPDAIGGTLEQNSALIDRWTTSIETYNVPSVPVWHLHEPVDYLRGLAARFKLVALGSSGAWSTPGTDAWWQRMNGAMSAICDRHGRPMCKLHGLRMLHPDVFTMLPLHSADSTNAAVNGGSTARFATYTPAEAWQRANIIADRVEQYASAACWQQDRQGRLWGELSPKGSELPEMP